MLRLYVWENDLLAGSEACDGLDAELTIGQRCFKTCARQDLFSTGMAALLSEAPARPRMPNGDLCPR